MHRVKSHPRLRLILGFFSHNIIFFIGHPFFMHGSVSPLVRHFIFFVMRWVTLFFIAGLAITLTGVYTFRYKIIDFFDLYVEKIAIYGQNRTSTRELYWAIGAKQNDHIWQHPLAEIKNRMESLPWVQAAIIQRILPHKLVVRIVEKHPVAIWQRQGKKHVIDKTGVPIIHAKAKNFPSLIIITGEKAPEYFKQLSTKLILLDGYLEVKGASFLRSQRWDIYVRTPHEKKEILVKLPENNIEKALKKLIRYWTILRNSDEIDLRFPDALIFQPKPLS